MAERYLFFNSTPTDERMYHAQDFAQYFGSVLSSGVLHADGIPGIKVTVEPGTLNVVVSEGRAIIKGHLYENTTPLTLAHSIPEPTLDRIDRIVLRLDLTNENRNIKLHVRTGTPATVPTAPDLTRTAFIYEISLARIKVRSNTVQLLPSDLVDERLDTSVSGLVSSLISIPTDQLQNFIDAKRVELGDEMSVALDAYLLSLAQAEQKLASDLTTWEQQWTDWFASVQGSSFVTGTEFLTHTEKTSSLTVSGHVKLSNSVTSASEVLAATPKAVKTAMDRADAAFTSASNGKSAIGAAITGVDPTVTVPLDPTFANLATAIGQINTGKKWASGIDSRTIPANGDESIFILHGLGITPTTVSVVDLARNNDASAVILNGTMRAIKKSGAFDSIEILSISNAYIQIRYLNGQTFSLNADLNWRAYE